MIDQAVVKDRLNAAVEALQLNDGYLLSINISERCLAGRLSIYLHGLFPGYAVDVEYNRAGEHPKLLGLEDKCANKKDGNGEVLVYPDIIVHRRGAAGPNILAIEIKKSTHDAGQECDRLRARAYKDQLGYQHAATILFDTRPHVSQAPPQVWWA